ncbi:hypothetical protein [Nocardioides donggukensis]|uniref:Uncharacterized protein n=1 Tax=Nocardioides donggukensis TaxID=2774019 RepID=A0A927K417_9ACTN|nr:hypothetical protein [Nocardioides donggukensis]MBD8869298.1 hypothetical protein [Nocardioides donggukensis]
MPINRPPQSREQAAAALSTAVRKADSAIYALRQRQGSMMPRQYERELQSARTAARESIQQARAELGAAIARERQAELRTSWPTAEDAARVTMYATQGMALAQAGMSDLESGVREQLAAGNQSAAREYLRAGGSRLQAHMRETGRVGDFRVLERAATSEFAARRQATVKALDTYAEQTARLDQHLRGLEGRLGLGDPDPVDGTTRIDVARVIDLWHTTAEESASEAGVAHVSEHATAAADTGVTDL